MLLCASLIVILVGSASSHLERAEEEVVAVPKFGSIVSIHSPNFPGLYPNDYKKQYYIYGPVGSQLQFDALVFNLAGSDYVEIFEDDWEGIPTSLDKFSLSRGPSLLRTSGNKAMVVFKSDSSVNQPGFHIIIRATVWTFEPELSFILLHAANSIASVQSPDYKYRNRNYPNNFWKQYDVIGPPGWILKFDAVAFDLEPDTSSACRYDYVEITEGSRSLGKFCGTQGPVNVRTSGRFETRFSFFTDGSLNRPGFNITIQAWASFPISS